MRSIRRLLVPAAAAIALLVAHPGEPAKPPDHIVKVVMKPARDGSCTIPDDVEKVDNASRGDLIRWEIQNDCATELVVGISGFCAPQRFAHLIEPREDPLDKKCARQTVVKGKGGTGQLECRIKKNTYYKRTYKYNIIGGTAILQDPEIEIEHP
jgi:hypothetical protein